MSERIDVLSRFCNMVEKHGPDECWIWSSVLNNKGYGCFYPGRQYGAKKIYAHRFAWILVHGKIPDKLNVLHSCDNPACVNPRHLRLGTHFDNMHDMISRGRDRHQFGEENPRSKLTWTQVREIRERYIPIKVSTVKLGKEYGVSSHQISCIVRGKVWREQLNA